MISINCALLRIEWFMLNVEQLGTHKGMPPHTMCERFPDS